jgi:hypothetical protein
VCYARTPENVRRLVAALGPLHPRLRGASPDLPFLWDERTVRNGLNFTLVTDLGEIDLLGEVTGLGNYDDLALRAIEAEVYGSWTSRRFASSRRKPDSPPPHLVVDAREV